MILKETCLEFIVYESYCGMPSVRFINIEENQSIRLYPAV